jgi:succinyl-diaminopimelate desuccinylase
LDESRLLHLACQLISRQSVTPDDGGCQALLAERLAAIGFSCEHLRFGSVSNLWAVRGSGHPMFCFAGHTDVVPSGPLEQWQSPPFSPTIRDGYLFGRGAADMKASIAAFVVALENFIDATPNHSGAIAVLLTSDEEGPSVDGTVRVVEILKGRGLTIDYCIVGEPSSSSLLGDTIKNGRRGSLSGRLHVSGVQGHVAYPDQVRNPIHLLAPALAELAQTKWDDGNQFFPPTSWQASNIHAGTGATNVVPGSLEMDFNFRYSTASTETSLRAKFESILFRHGIEFSIDWNSSGSAFLTEPADLVQAVSSAVEKHTGAAPKLSTSGGTSDGRFIAQICPQIIELGPPNNSIHKLNEHILVEDLERLSNIYLDTLNLMLPALRGA